MVVRVEEVIGEVKVVYGRCACLFDDGRYGIEVDVGINGFTNRIFQSSVRLVVPATHLIAILDLHSVIADIELLDGLALLSTTHTQNGCAVSVVIGQPDTGLLRHSQLILHSLFAITHFNDDNTLGVIAFVNDIGDRTRFLLCQYRILLTGQRVIVT